MSPEIIGYASSITLLITIGSQIYKQWQSGTSKGVSIWLFIGQLVTSIGFTIYSVLTHSTVFTLTNCCLGVAALIGICIVAYHRRKNRSASRTDSDSPCRYGIRRGSAAWLSRDFSITKG